MKKIILYLICFILVSSCSNNKYSSTKELKLMSEVEILMDNYKFEEAIKKANELERISPGYTPPMSDLNIYLFFGKSYAYLGNFEKYIEYTKKASELSYNSIFVDLIGYTFYDNYFLTSAIKIKRLDIAYQLLDKYNKAFPKMNGLFKNPDKAVIFNLKKEKLYPVLFQFIRDADIDNLAFCILNKDNNFEKQVDEDIQVLFDNYVSEKNTKENIINVLFNLLSYQIVDKSYPLDIIWSRNVIKNKFKEYNDKGFISKKTLERLKKIVHRKELPESFIKLFDGMK